MKASTIGASSSLAPRTGRAIYAASCAGLLVFSTTFVGLATAESVTLPWYDAVGHAWHLAESQPAPAAMDWYGRVLISCFASAIASLAVFFIGRTRDIPTTALRAASIWALGATILGLFLYAWTLANRLILPPGS